MLFVAEQWLPFCFLEMATIQHIVTTVQEKLLHENWTRLIESFFSVTHGNTLAVL